MSLRILWLILFCSFQTANACDICGSNPNSMYVGLLPNYTNHFVGLKHRFVKFETEHNDKQEYGQDVLHETTLWGRYNLNKKIQIYASIPYLINNRIDNHTSYVIHGLGDASILANYTLIDNTDSLNGKLYHFLQTGVGIKLPSGQSDLIANGNTVIPMLQLGTGSTDILASVFYMMRLKKLGWSLDGNYKWNTTGANDYRMGNSLNANWRCFYWYQRPKHAWVPSVGLGWEHMEANIDRGIERELTGGNALMSSIGLQLFKGKFSIGSTFQLPIHQNINSGFTQGSFRISNQINIFF
ncbi:MAG: hypothetical protein ACK5UE_13870 [Chitinophagales bacterium]|jgi:hypothetical protein|nr:hypothetical protein [Sphingobacteriales bacterium]